MMKSILSDGYLPLIGPRIAINDFYLGPLYYYILAGFYFVTNLDPIAASCFVASTYIASSVSIYYVAKRMFEKYVALVTLTLYVASYFQVMSDKPAWNVSLIIPIVTWLIFCLWKVWEGRVKWIIGVFLCIALMLHVHITIVFLAPSVFLVLYKSRKVKSFWKCTLMGALLILLSASSIFAYELISGFQNAQSIGAFIIADGQIPVLSFALSRLNDVFFMFEALIHMPELAIMAFIIPILFWIIARNQKESSAQFLSIVSLLVFSTTWISLVFYRNTIFEYYFLITGVFMYFMTSYVFVYFLSCKKYVYKIIAGTVLTMLISINLSALGSNWYTSGLRQEKEEILRRIDQGEQIEFNEGEIQSYLYWYYVEKNY